MDAVSQVIRGGYCVGCGVCPFVDSTLKIAMNEDGKYQATELSEKHDAEASQVCPFANSSYNEDAISRELYGNVDGVRHDDALGYYLHTYVGFAATNGFRERGSSGGLVNWMASKLLETGRVDAVIHVKPSNEPGIMYSYQVSHTVDELNQGAKSKYYPIELSHVLEYVREHDERYAVVGIPCFIKALRMLEHEEPLVKERIRYHLGLVCGHLKSTFFALSEAWESGIEPGNVESVDFRYKIPGRAASDYGIKAVGRDSQGDPVEVVKPTRELSTTNWGYGYFKYMACEYCDDVLAETADVTCGDAWLPQYVSDGKGTNVVVVRNPEIQTLFDEFSKEVHMEPVPASVIAKSQSSGIRHRREGLKYRLYLKDQKHEWRPTKRVQASNDLPERRKKVYEGRIQLIEESFNAYHHALDSGQGMPAFVEHMQPILTEYKKADTPPLWRRAMRKVKRQLKKMIRRH
ncbi:Coenzyme F420 hydrogenase/dehydrogenase, beta subunit C-terminal domain [Bifidobacterium sp. SO1]|uniref:Coenzyme F420 hydrogenase/dehydrogenase, beta subunit C-terminal domain n=1 Tax=Bifidobacterium sp. SO1 TaxID=2809029 RepID=UPI001BDC1C38|nr:Coenzyme F420 hydrogenase/dehydrogenase, beta subunit C-terminal domain [Bifidobacterium sp. SO1]MBT1161024.1 Coenzyme F420 hydrogenase/dehydrogenase, beta subunit C-terminal domain [Bifidobacterium sp. SO1]